MDPAPRRDPPSETRAETLESSRRPALLYGGLLVTTILLGLATRRFPGAFPEVVARFGGDALWAAMVLWLLALWRRSAAPYRLALAALAIAWAVEFSQWYQAPWIDAVRSTRVGALVLGQGFLWSDLVSYVVGVGLAAALDAGIVRRRHGRLDAPGRGHRA